MIGVEELNKIKSLLLNDERLCRLLVHKNNPMDVNNDDVVGNPKYEKVLSDIFKFQPQYVDLITEEMCRIAIYKGRVNKILHSDILRNETIQIDLMIPTRLNDLDLRVYQIEERILELLDDKRISEFSKIVCNAALFMSAPSITEYSIYKMSFDKVDYRNVNKPR